MLIRLIVLSLFLPVAAFAQQGTPHGECEGKRCPDGQIMDSATKTCVDISA